MESSDKISRRSFLGKSALATAALSFGGNIPNLLAGNKKPAESHSKIIKPGSFPDDFWWGSATAAYQVEGAANADGRGKSIWDTFSHTPGKTLNGDTGDVSCDQYHLYEEDIKLMAELGIKHYRFSIAWPRIMPEGRGKVNEKGVDYYKRLTDSLLKHGIMPHATLYHWDLPQALQDKYKGWESRDVIGDFGDYSTAVVSRLGDRIQHWMTLNEISTMSYVSYGINRNGYFAPGVQLSRKKELHQIIHNMMLAHGTSCQAIRAASPQKCFVSIANDQVNFVPVIETAANIEAAKKAFVREEHNGGIIVPILTGKYNDKWLEDCGTEAPDISTGDMKLISQPLDEFGFNCYTGFYVEAADNAKGFEVMPFNDNYPTGNMPWLKIVPESIYWGIRHIGEALGQPKLPVFISENGCADGTVMTEKGDVNDIDRIMYYRAYLNQVQRAVAEGYPVKGYLPWSLLDNFEWGSGYSKRFGMVHVDYKTLKRTPKLSYKWYQEVIKNNRVM